MDDKIMARMALAQVQVEKVNFASQINKAIRSCGQIKVKFEGEPHGSIPAQYG